MKKQRKLNPPVSPFSKGGKGKSLRPFLSIEGPALIVLAVSFLFCFWDWFSHLSSKVFLSLDMTFAYYPLYHWVHEHLVQGKLPLISDLAYNGAPVAAVEMIGILSPALWLLHLFHSFIIDFNLLFLCPLALYLFGTYFLGLRLGLSRSASLLLAFLWTYNGHQMAQLDHLNVVWAHAFFPWAFLGLVEYLKSDKAFWLISAGFLFGLNVLSGHPQIAFLEGLFFLAWIFLADLPQTYPLPLRERDRVRGTKNSAQLFTLTPTLSRQGRGRLRRKIAATLGLFLGALVTSSAQLLFTLECQGGESFNQWGEADRFFHSWTPLNFLTLVFPWFFGKEQFDRAGTDYWWQYQFVEMQVAFGLVGLFFILMFFVSKNSQRRWIGITGLFGLLMAFGKFFFVYSLVQKLPFFSLFRDPARYWFLVTWAVGLGAAYAWDEWFKDSHPHPSPLPSRERGKNLKTKKPSRLGFGFAGTQGVFPVRAVREMGRVRGYFVDVKIFSLGQKLCWGLIAFTPGVLLLGWFFLNPGRPLLQGMASWAIGHFLSSDGIHTQPISVYQGRIQEKLDALAFNLDPRNPRVFLPLLFLAALTTCLFNRLKWKINFQKGFLLLLLFTDLMAFRMPIGNSFYNPNDIPQPSYPAPQNRSLVLLSGNVSPLPTQYGEVAFPNWNFLSNRPNIAFVANPQLPRYFKILSDLGWFSWVYKDRDPLGFTKHVEALQILGVDQIVSDVPLSLPKPFKTIQNIYPFAYYLPGAYPKAYIEKHFSESAMVTNLSSLKPIIKNTNINPPEPKILTRNETHLSIFVKNNLQQPWEETNLILQKTFLTGWKTYINGKVVKANCAATAVTSSNFNNANNKTVERFKPEVLGKSPKEKALAIEKMRAELDDNFNKLELPFETLMNIPIQAGENHIELIFNPPSLRLGFFLFFLFFGVFTFSLFRRLVA